MKPLITLILLACVGSHLHVHASPRPAGTDPQYPHPYPNLNARHWWNREVRLTADFLVKWNSFDKEWLVMEMSTKTSGYIALGISPNGGMNHADIVMAWVDANGEPHIKDLYGVGNTVPIEDTESNYELLHGEEKDGRTTIKFRRRWDTCDDRQDMVINEDTIRLLWAQNDKDPLLPLDEKPFSPAYHVNMRGVRSVFLKAESQHEKFPEEDEHGNILDPDVKAWDVRSDNNSINAEATVYHCSIIKFPHLEKKHQIIGFRPLLEIEGGGGAYIHHMMFYECVIPASDGGTEAVFEKYVGAPSERCYSQAMPAEWLRNCVTVPFIWDLGGEGDMLPRHSGIPLGEPHDGATYFMLEVHYDNPQLKTFYDNSGVRIYYTDKLREFDGAIIYAGHRISNFFTMPPKMDSYLTTAICTSECTQKGLPEDGITITKVLFHSHRAARKTALRHIRNGTELEPLSLDNHYDFNYQQSRALIPPRKLLPGDELLIQCDYETKDRDKVTLGGVASTDEMCVAFIHYYPKVELVHCSSQPELHSYLKALNVEKVEGEIFNKIGIPYKNEPGMRADPPDDIFLMENFTASDTNSVTGLDLMNIVEPIEMRGKSLGDVFRENDWAANGGRLGQALRKKLYSNEQYAFCVGGGRKKIPLDNMITLPPKILKKWRPPNNRHCAKRQGPVQQISSKVRLQGAYDPEVMGVKEGDETIVLN